MYLPMETGLQIFEQAEFGKARVIESDGEFWFVARDVTEALGYGTDSKMGALLKNVPNEWKGVNSIYTPGGRQDMATLSEQGLYFFVCRSDKPKALPFQKWIAGDVLPSIRKHGGYLHGSLTKNDLQKEQQLRMISE